jgi:hypothetical protein
LNSDVSKNLLIGIFRTRIERLKKLVVVVYRETGSIKQATLFGARLFSRKAPVFVKRILRPGKSSSEIVGELRQARADDKSVPLIAVRIGGVIGDHIVIARFMRDLVDSVENVQFDIYSGSPDVARWLFARIKGFRSALLDVRFDSTIEEYDIGLMIDQAAILREKDRKRLPMKHCPKLAKVCEKILSYRPKIDDFLANQPLLADALARHAVFANTTRRDFLHKIAGISYGGDRLNVATVPAAMSRFGLEGKTYVTVHNGYDQNFILSSDRLATKCYPHFGRVLAELKAAFPGLLTVQLGSSTSDPLAEADLNLIDKTSLLEAAEVLRQSILHLDNEGGLVHLASCFGVRSCVVFGPTPSNYFGYPGNLNIDPKFCGGCWWVSPNWMDKCPRAFATARCMSEQDSRSVSGAVERYLRLKIPIKEDASQANIN